MSVYFKKTITIFQNSQEGADWNHLSLLVMFFVSSKYNIYQGPARREWLNDVFKLLFRYNFRNKLGQPLAYLDKIELYFSNQSMLAKFISLKEIK